MPPRLESLSWTILRRIVASSLVRAGRRDDRDRDDERRRRRRKRRRRPRPDARG